MAEESPVREPRPNLWSRAAFAAANTPESRNRYVDFLRALSITAVIFGHWLVTTAVYADGKLILGDMLDYQNWTQWLTWLFQVMPIFFLVGGYANGTSWMAALRDGKSYREWLDARLGRLIGPVLPLLVVWAAIGVAGPALGASEEVLSKASQTAIVPAWFLAVYVMVVVLVPTTFRAWRRFGFHTVWVLLAAAAIDDAFFFSTGREWVGYFNFAFIWFAMHQMGYAWRDGRLGGRGKTLLLGLCGLALLATLTTSGAFQYPVHMAGRHGPAPNNSFPPKLPMLALGIAQCGLLLSVEAPMRRWLSRARPWTATLLVNNMIMTIYLWHFTASTAVLGVGYLLAKNGLTLGRMGLGVDPATAGWWVARPLWLGLYIAALAALVGVFGRFERTPKGAARDAWRQIVGALVMGLGLAMLARDGIVFEGWLAARTWVFALPIAGAALAGIPPFHSQGRPETAPPS